MAELDYYKLLGGVEAVKSFFGVADGMPGTITPALRSAVAEFQRQNHFAVDGILGPQTAPALKKVMAVDTVVFTDSEGSVVTPSTTPAAPFEVPTLFEIPTMSADTKALLGYGAVIMVGVAIFMLFIASEPLPTRPVKSVTRRTVRLPALAGWAEDVAQVDVGRFEKLHDAHKARREKLLDLMYSPDISKDQIYLASAASRAHLDAASSYQTALVITDYGNGKGKGNLKGALASIKEEEERVARTEKLLKASGVSV
jgi:hypothetical protein